MLSTTGRKLERTRGSIVNRISVAAGFLGHPVHLERYGVHVAKQHATRFWPHHEPQFAIRAELDAVQARDGLRQGRKRYEKRTQEATHEGGATG